MANTSAILLALMVVATASVAHGKDLGVAVQVNITGDVKCLVAGKPNPVGLAGVNVYVTYNKTTLAQGITDPQGRIALSVKLTDSTVSTATDISQWLVKAVIPPRTSALTLPTRIVEKKLDVKSVVVTPREKKLDVKSVVLTSSASVGIGADVHLTL